MRRLSLLGAVVLGACSAAPPADRLAILRQAIAELARAEAPRRVCVAYLDLRTGDALEIDATDVLHAASTMKLAVMVELFRRVDRAEFTLDGCVTLRNAFRSIMDGSGYALNPEDDSDGELYSRVGSPVSLGELCTRMIQRSSNLATNVLVELLGAPQIQATIEALGARGGMVVRRGVEDGPAFRAGANNVTSARDLVVLLRSIADGSAASPGACARMIAILSGQKAKDMIPAGLPPHTEVAHKTGTITRIHHDAAIVDPRGTTPWILVVLTADFDDEADAARCGAQIAREIADWRSRAVTVEDRR